MLPYIEQANVLAASSQTTNSGVVSTTIHLGGSSSITLDGVSMTSLTVADVRTNTPPNVVTGNAANNFSATFVGSSHQYTIGAAGSYVTGGPENASDSLANIQKIQFVDGYETYSTSDTAAATR